MALMVALNFQYSLAAKPAQAMAWAKAMIGTAPEWLAA
jgi:hypothetical protein